MIVVSPVAGDPPGEFVRRVADAMLDVEAGFRRAAPGAAASPWPTLESAGAAFTWRAYRGWLFVAAPGGVAALAAALMPALDAAAAVRAADGERRLRPAGDGAARASPLARVTVVSASALASARGSAVRRADVAGDEVGPDDVRLLTLATPDDSRTCRCDAVAATTSGAPRVPPAFEWFVIGASAAARYSSWGDGDAAARHSAWNDADVEIAFASVVAFAPAAGGVRAPAGGGVQAPAGGGVADRIGLPPGVGLAVEFEIGSIIPGGVRRMFEYPPTAALAGFTHWFSFALAVTHGGRVSIVPAIDSQTIADRPRIAARARARAAVVIERPMPADRECIGCELPPAAGVWGVSHNHHELLPDTLVCTLCARASNIAGVRAPTNPLQPQAMRLEALAQRNDRHDRARACAARSLAALAGARATRLPVARGGAAYEFAGDKIATFVAVEDVVDCLDAAVAARIAAGAIVVTGLIIFEPKNAN